MFGKNEITKADMRLDGALRVHSMFYTIQGEGPHAGHPAVFLRLAGCNLRCYFCDTDFSHTETYTATKLHLMLQDILFQHSCGLVVITGGEPFIQNIAPLVALLNRSCVDVDIETAGTVFTKEAFEVAAYKTNKIVCSPKTPGINLELVPYVSAWKYIISVDNTDEHDGLPMMSTQSPNVRQAIYRPKRFRGCPIYVQPMDELDPVRNEANLKHAAKIAMKFGYRLSVQMHKLAGVP